MSSSRVNRLATTIFETLKGYGFQITVYDASGNKCFVPSEGRSFFSNKADIAIFIYEDGYNTQMKVFISGTKTDPTTDHMSLLRNLRKTSVKHRVGFSVRKYGRSVKPRMFAFMNVSSIGETKKFKQTIGNTTIIIERQNDEIVDIILKNNGKNYPYGGSLEGARAAAKYINKNGVDNKIIQLENWDIAVHDLQTLKKHLWENRNTISDNAKKYLKIIDQKKNQYSTMIENVFKTGDINVVETIVESSKSKKCFNNFELSYDMIGITDCLFEQTTNVKKPSQKVHITQMNSRLNESLSLRQYFEQFDLNNVLSKKSEFKKEVVETVEDIKPDYWNVVQTFITEGFIDLEDCYCDELVEFATDNFKADIAIEIYEEVKKKKNKKTITLPGTDDDSLLGKINVKSKNKVVYNDDLVEPVFEDIGVENPAIKYLEDNSILDVSSAKVIQLSDGIFEVSNVFENSKEVLVIVYLPETSEGGVDGDFEIKDIKK